MGKAQQNSSFLIMKVPDVIYVNFLSSNESIYASLAHACGGTP
jgi:hypothetical protein